MPNVATVLKEEITRLARKEIRTSNANLRDASSRYRGDIAELKRQVNDLARQVGKLQRELGKTQKKSAATGSGSGDTDNSGHRFSAKGLRTHRSKLGLSASDYGDLVGVTGQSIYNWEAEVSRPRASVMGSLRDVRSLGKREAIQRLEGNG